MEEIIQNRVDKLSNYLKEFHKKILRGLDDVEGLDKPGIYFIYDPTGHLAYIGTTDRPLGDRLKELRDQPKDHTFHAKHVRNALEKRLGRKIKKFDAKKLSKFSGHALLTLSDFKKVLEETKLMIGKNYKHRTIEVENTLENLKQAKALEHFAIAIFEPVWNDKVDRVVSELEVVELFKQNTEE